jgi:hypothetical protein
VRNWKAKTCGQYELGSGWSKDLHRNQTLGIGDELELPMSDFSKPINSRSVRGNQIHDLTCIVVKPCPS